MLNTETLFMAQLIIISVAVIYLVVRDLMEYFIKDDQDYFVSVTIYHVDGSETKLNAYFSVEGNSKKSAEDAANEAIQAILKQDTDIPDYTEILINSLSKV